MSINLASGENVTCTFNNTQGRGKITIKKETDPDGSPQSFNFTGSGGLGSFNLTDGGNKPFSDLLPGTYNFTETVPGDWTLSSVNCTGGSCTNITNGVSINLASGGNVTCTFNNTFVSPKITVTKVVVGGPPKSAGDFNLHVQGQDFTDNGTGTEITLTPGAYNVTEDDYTPVYTTTFSGNCTGTAAAGDVLTCTVTNTFLEPEVSLPVMFIDYDVLTTPPVVEPGGQVQYQIWVANSGSGNATNVSIWAALPAGFTYASTGGIINTGGAVHSTTYPTTGDPAPLWDSWSIPSGGTVTITFTVDVGTGVGPGTYDSTAYADGDNFAQIDDEGEAGQDANTPPGEDPEPDEDVTIREVLPSPAVGGEAYPVNKIAILAPWIAIAMAIIAGSFIVVRRRRAQS